MRYRNTIRLNDEERRRIYRHAQHRWRTKEGRGVDRTEQKSQDRTLLNAIGIAGEVGWARYFGVPWYQNPGEGGDHHRDGDIQLRSKVWLEVKTTRNPKGVTLHRSTADRFTFLAFANYQEKEKKIQLVGVMPKDRIEHDKLDAAEFGNPQFLLDRTIHLPRPGKAEGLLCPWCLKQSWPCTYAGCERALQRREGR